MSVVDMKVEKVETRNVKGSTTCVCWLQEQQFRRVEDVIGFSTQPGSGLQSGEYKMVNSARKLFIYLGNENLEFFQNKFANHNI